MSRCLICDGIRAGARQPRGAIVMVAATAAMLGLENIKASMCPEHRSRWVLDLVNGGSLFEQIARLYPEPEVEL